MILKFFFVEEKSTFAYTFIDSPSYSAKEECNFVIFFQLNFICFKLFLMCKEG